MMPFIQNIQREIHGDRKRFVVARLEGEGLPAGYGILLQRVTKVLELGRGGGCTAW